MSDRTRLINDFLQGSRWAGWRRTAMTGDASARRYLRLEQGADSVIVMDAPPGNGEGTQTFARIGAALAETGLCPPAVLAHDPAQGIMVLSDLGHDDFARWLAAHPGDSALLYGAAVDVLIHLHATSTDLSLPVMNPELGGQMVALACEFYADVPAAPLVREVTAALSACAPVADRLALRDFHAENLIWRPALSGAARVGLLDFQDAFIAPAGYDLVSLLRDARRDVDPALVQDMIARFTAGTNVSPDFPAQFACLGAQRNLRILGVFARLAKQAGKTRYLDLIPRVWCNLMLDLAHPALADLRAVVHDLLPPPQPDKMP